MSKTHNHEYDPACKEYANPGGRGIVGECVLKAHTISPVEYWKGSRQSEVNPDHYSGDLVMRVIEERGLDFALGNTVKYVCRAGSKGDKMTDLKKALWYLERAITKEETSE